MNTKQRRAKQRRQHKARAANVQAHRPSLAPFLNAENDPWDTKNDPWGADVYLGGGGNGGGSITHVQPVTNERGVRVIIEPRDVLPVVSTVYPPPETLSENTGPLPEELAAIETATEPGDTMKLPELRQLVKTRGYKGGIARLSRPQCLEILSGL